MAIVELVLKHFAYSITSLIFIIVLIITFAFISKFAKLEASWLGILRTPINTRFLSAVLFGMIIGIIASFCFVIIGVPLDFNSVLYIWPLAIFLMLLNRRFMCLSYAGGLISISSLFFGWPDIEVPAVIALVGILHLMESLLILTDGHKDNLPILIKHKENNSVGAYIMNKVWPIPLVILIVPDQITHVADQVIKMPDWWPLFHQPGVEVLALFPIVAIMGYSDVAITKHSQIKVRETGLWLGVYSITIIMLALIASRFHWASYLAAFAAPILHELLIQVSKNKQLSGKPAFDAPYVGVRILDVTQNSHAEKMGLKPGDIILSINGKDVNSREMIDLVLSNYPSFVWLNVKREDNIAHVEYKEYQTGVHDLGILIVPRQTSKHFRLDGKHSIIVQMCLKVYQKLFRKTKKV